MAKAYYNFFTKTQDAESAGTHVKEVGQTLIERKTASDSQNFFVLDVMKDDGIDISDYVRNQLTEDQLAEYDAVVSMASETDAPEWLLTSPKYVFWDVKDPRGQDYATTKAVRDEIKQRVEDFISSSPSSIIGVLSLIHI